MFSSTKVARIAGIDIYIHSTFYLLIGWILFSYWMGGQTLAAAVSGVGFILLIFLCIVLHEYGHALAARKFGVQTKDITLYPIGGVARLEKMPEEPMEEFWVALAGPAVNVVIAAGIGLYLYLTGSFVPLQNLGIAEGSMAERIMIVNIFLVGFNLLPAFPMDGGRVLRALLATRMNYLTATRIAAQIGKGMALVFGFVGLMVNPLLIFIAFFVWIGASGEASQVQFRQLLEGVPVSEVMIREFTSVAPDDNLATLRNVFMKEPHKEIPVIKDGQFVGIVSVQDLIEGLRDQGEESLVQDVMNKKFVEVTSLDMLETAFRKLQDHGQTLAPVVDEGNLTGIVTDEQTGKYLMFRSSQRAA